MMARRNIRAGEEVTDFYGTHYFQSPRRDRRAMLGFHCECLACREDWPLLPSLPRLTRAQRSHRATWTAARERMESAGASMRVRETQELCMRLARTHGEFTAEVLPSSLTDL